MTDLFDTPLGPMRVLEVYVYYDGPQLFACEDPTGQTYMVHGMEGDSAATRFFLVPMSRERLEEVRTGSITLRESILRSETGHLFDVSIPYGSATGDFKVRTVDGLDEMELPVESLCLNAMPERLPALESTADVIAQRTQRDIVLLKLETKVKRQLFDGTLIGRLMIACQELVRSLAAPHLPRLTQIIGEKNSMCPTALFAASYGLRFESKYPADLAGTTTHASLKELMALLQAGDDNLRLSELLPKMRWQARRRYGFLLSVLDEADADLEAVWGSPEGTSSDARLTVQQARRVAGMLAEDEESLTRQFTVFGSLVSVTLIEGRGRRKSRTVFEFMDTNNKMYKGELHEGLLLRQFRVPSHNVAATLEETIELNPLTGRESSTYVLVSIPD